MARFRQHHLAVTTAPRQGTVLLIVIVFLTIFASLGLAFMFYADSDEQAADAFLGAVQPQAPPISPEAAFSEFLRQLIYDCRDDETGAYSAMRGWGLLRNMYGQNLGVDPVTGQVTLIDGNGNPINNATAFSGTGRLHFNFPGGTPVIGGLDDYNLPNYAYFPQDGFLRDPERYGTRPGLRPAGQPDNRKAYIGGPNPGYTACDLNCMCLAAVKADGTVLMPSYFRDYNGFGKLGPDNQNWYNTVDGRLKYMVLRPRPADHPSVVVNGITKPGFPAPEDANGDVQNLKWGKGNDSIWLYTGAPIWTLPDGRKYTMLFAPCIIDLDGKVNLNVTGNISRNNAFNGSNMGWGPWEVNPGQFLFANEYKNLFLGVNAPGSATPYVVGRYGVDGQPGLLPTTSATFNRNGKVPHFYNRVDFKGTATASWTLPFGAGQMWPTYPASYLNANANDRLQHPELYNVFNPSLVNTTAAGVTRMNYAFGIAEMDKLLRYGDIGTEAMVSDLFMLCPNSFASLTNPTLSLKTRHLVTTSSWDLNSVATAPWLYTAPAGANLKYTMAGAAWQMPQGGGSIQFPAPTTFPGGASGGEFTGDWRGKPFTPGKLDLNQLLPAYPTPNAANFRFPQRIDPVTGNLALDTTNAAYITFINAQTARQNLARSIFYTFVRVTGAVDLANYKAAQGPLAVGDFYALAYLAQLSVNIVDYIDDDDFITPFNWATMGSPDFQTAFAAFQPNLPPGSNFGWVFGVEMPKVVINEAYAQITNDPADPGLGMAPPVATTNYLVDVWAELCNPFNTDASLFQNGDARLYMFPTVPGNPATGYPVYKLLVTDPNTTMHAPGNSMGLPNGPVRGAVAKEFNFLPGSPGVDVSKIQRANGNFAAPTNQGSNVGFYMVGPSAVDPKTNLPTPVPFPNTGGPGLAPPTATVNSPGMRLPPIAVAAGAAPTPPTLVLQRLLCPQAPPDPNPASPTYNPYITVDYFENIPVNVGVTADPTGKQPPTFKAITARSSIGRLQPYAGDNPNNVALQQVTYANQPEHTFFSHNYPVKGSTVTPIPGPGAWPKIAPFNFGWYTVNFDWLIHLDRPLVSPIELLHVSDVRPHELTQTFVQPGIAGTAAAGAPTANMQRVGKGLGWFNNNARLYRFLEYVQTWCYKNEDLNVTAATNTSPIVITTGNSNVIGGLTTGSQVTITGVNGNTAANGTWTITVQSATKFSLNGSAGNGVYTSGGVALPVGRLPGKINLNTVWDPEIFLALCDRQLGSHFMDQDPNGVFPNQVMDIFAKMLALRSPRTITTAGLTQNYPGPNENPFRPMSTGFTNGDAIFTNGAGVQTTLLKPYIANGTVTGQRLFELTPTLNGKATPTPDHPVARFELLNKIYNSVTTRSNVFAVWVTVGFFEVNQVTTVNGGTRIWLGQEIGRADNKHVRHRMFAIVDRSTQPNNGLGGAATNVNLNILNQTTPFNPRNNPALIPYFTVIE
jgi:hypothetical protein